MSGSAHALVAGLVALVTLISAPAPAAWAAPPQAYPSWAQPVQQPLAPPGATAPASRVPDRASWQVYDAASKSEGLAVVLELFLPGLGSIYAEHWTGAATTWGLAVGGIGLVAWAFGQTSLDADQGASDSAGLVFAAGILMVVGGRVYGLVDSFRSTGRYNLELGRRLGLHGGLVLSPIPLQVNGQTSLGLGASWQF
jgi:hypothetical protein